MAEPTGPAPAKTCSHCHSPLADAAQVCPHCGYTQTPEGAVPPAKASAPAATGAPLAGPWPRYWARSLDLALGTLIVWALVMFLAPGVVTYALASRLHGVLIAPPLLLVALGLDALCYSLAGNTPAKWLVGIRVADREGGRLPAPRYLARNLRLSWAGLGLGIPLITLITLLMSYDNLRRGVPVSWDERTDSHVLRVRGGLGRTWVAALLYFVVTIATVLAELVGNLSPATQLEIFAAVANSGAPTGDEHLRLERVSAAPGMVLLYQYTLLDPTDDLAALRQQLPPRTAPAKVLCDDPDMLRAGVRVRWHFSDRRGRDVGTVEAGPQDCGADKAQDAPD